MGALFFQHGVQHDTGHGGIIHHELAHPLPGLEGGLGQLPAFGRGHLVQALINGPTALMIQRQLRFGQADAIRANSHSGQQFLVREHAARKGRGVLAGQRAQGHGLGGHAQIGGLGRLAQADGGLEHGSGSGRVQVGQNVRRQLRRARAGCLDVHVPLVDAVPDPPEMLVGQSLVQLRLYALERAKRLGPLGQVADQAGHGGCDPGRGALVIRVGCGEGAIRHGAATAHAWRAGYRLAPNTLARHHGLAGAHDQITHFRVAHLQARQHAANGTADKRDKPFQGGRFHAGLGPMRQHLFRGHAALVAFGQIQPIGVGNLRGRVAHGAILPGDIQGAMVLRVGHDQPQAVM